MALFRNPWTPTLKRINRCENPRAAVSTAGWATSNATLGRAAEGTVSPYMFTVDPTTTGSDLWAYSTFNSTASRWFAASVTVRASYGTTTRIVIHWRDSAGALIAAPQWDFPHATWTWTRVATPVIASPPNAVSSRIYVQRLGPYAPGNFLHFTSVLVEQGVTAFDVGSGIYFDGSTAPGPDSVYAWMGSVGLSASTHSVPDTASTIQTILALRPYEARREASTIMHPLLDEDTSLFTWRPAPLPSGVFRFLFDNYTVAYAALSALGANTAWTWYDVTDSGNTEVWFMVAGGDIELRQDEDVPNMWVLSVPYVEVDSL